MITGIVLAKNEEKNIQKCVESLDFCNEIVIVDDNSTDQTIYKKLPRKVKVVNRALNNDFAAQRNYALTLAANEWVLFVDADEIVSEMLKKEILQAITRPKSNAYYIKREDILFGRHLKHGELLGKKFIRLGRVDAGKWTGSVHEEWRVNGEVKTLQSPLLHKPHQTISEFLSEINFYTTLRAEELSKEGVRSSFFVIVVYPLVKFIQTYFIKRGFLDGMPGFLVSIMMSFHSFLVRGKLFLLQNKK